MITIYKIHIFHISTNITSMVHVYSRPFAMKILILTIAFTCCISTIWTSRILGIFPMPGYSHYILGQRLLEELANKGHDVTIITPFKENRKIQNYNEIHLEGLADIIKDLHTITFDIVTAPFINQAIFCYKLGQAFSNFTLHNQPVKDLINSNKKFDVVIMEHFFNEALLAIPYKLNAPVVLITTTPSSMWINHLVANPAPLSQIPKVISHYNGTMNFFQRLDNIYQHLTEELYRRLIAYPIHNRIVQETFPGFPDLNTLMYSRSPFILLNSHVSTNDPMPHVPNMIEIGGFHPRKQKLPLNLKEYLDNSPNGVIFFGMGSLLKVSSLPANKREAILKALGKLKQNVLLKWEDDYLPEQPPNVKISKWLPQQAILAHPNIKAFISHGGLLSTIEAVYFGVPIIGIPIFADQNMNMNLAVNRGYAISIPFTELTEENLSTALNQILFNTRYLQKVKAFSALMKDRLVPPLQEAVYWVEHVIKHNGSEHFRSPAMDLRWYEYEMLDVAAFFILAVVIFVILDLSCKRLIRSIKAIKRNSMHKKKN